MAFFPLCGVCVCVQDPEVFPVDLLSSIAEAPKSLAEHGFQVEICSRSFVFSCKTIAEAQVCLVVISRVS